MKQRASKTRRCEVCGETKPLAEYLPMPRGFRSCWCNDCAVHAMRRYWANRRDAADLTKVREKPD